jgi:hypothetical protein
MNRFRSNESERWGVMIADLLKFAVCFIGLMSAGLWVALLDPNWALVDAELFQERLTHLRLRGFVNDRRAPLSVHVNLLNVASRGTQDHDFWWGEQSLSSVAARNRSRLLCGLRLYGIVDPHAGREKSQHSNADRLDLIATTSLFKR